MTKTKSTPEKFKKNDVYFSKLAFAKSLGYQNLAEAIAGIKDFETRFKASQNTGKIKKPKPH